MKQSETEESLLGPYRVLDLTEGGCLIGGRILGDLGADVIKIEPPGGSTSRNIAPFYKDKVDREKSLFWFAYNANKRGITLNIETIDGRELFKRLVKGADFVIESFPPGYMKKLGLGYSNLNKINPRIIVTSITPFGQTGPKAHYKGSELTEWAAGEMLYISGDADRPPNWISFPQAGLHGGAQAATGSMLAHQHRQMTGRGQHVDVSIQLSVERTTRGNPIFWALAKEIFVRAGHANPTRRAIQRQGFPCADGYVTAVIVGGTGETIASNKALVEWMAEEGKAPDWLKKFDWVNEFDASRYDQALVDRVYAPFADFFRSKTKAEVFREAVKRRVLVAPVNDSKDVFEMEQLKARKFWEKVEHPELHDNLTYLGPFVKVSEAPIRIRRRAPRLGEHNVEIYVNELGLSGEELSLLRQAGVI